MPVSHHFGWNASCFHDAHGLFQYSDFWKKFRLLLSHDSLMTHGQFENTSWGKWYFLYYIIDFFFNAVGWYSFPPWGMPAVYQQCVSSSHWPCCLDLKSALKDLIQQTILSPWTKHILKCKCMHVRLTFAQADDQTKHIPMCLDEQQGICACA